MVYTPMTSDLSPPPPPALSHHSPGPQTLSPVSGPENKVARRGPARLGPAQPSTIDPAFGDLFERAMKNRWTLRKGLRRGGDGGRKKGSLVKYLRRKITQGRCLIISICLVWFCWGGHVVSLAAPWFIFHII